MKLLQVVASLSRPRWSAPGLIFLFRDIRIERAGEMISGLFWRLEACFRITVPPWPIIQGRPPVQRLRNRRFMRNHFIGVLRSEVTRRVSTRTPDRGRSSWKAATPVFQGLAK